MFRSTTLKLTGVYLAIIMVISLFFSANLYSLATRELDRGFRRQQAIIERVSPFDPYGDGNEVLNERNQAIRSAKQHIFGQLVFINIVILGLGGVMSYLLARRTLRPIEEAHEAQKRFTADASHELRTPLTAMQTEIEVALRDPKLTKEEAKELLRSNLEELATLTQLSDGLLRLARLESNNLPKKPVRVAAVLDKAVQANQALAEQKGILLEAQKGPQLTVMGDQASLVEMLSILINNAIKYSPAKSSVRLQYEKRGKEVVISVVDHGVGINQVDLPRIFERFYRADSSRSRQQVAGYGLGLPIAKSLAEMHSGYITVKSTVNKGSTFQVHLPLSN